MPKHPLTPAVREVIADSLHAALLKFMQPSVMHIGPINTIGCFLLKHLTGDGFVPVAGSVEVRCGGTPFGIQAHIENIDIHAYYVWIECDRGAHGIEVVDFGARYWKPWASGEGILWSGPSPPKFVWGLHDELNGYARYSPHDEISDTVRRAIEDAVAVLKPDSSVEKWETAINDAIDAMLDTEAGLDYLIKTGIARPVDEEPYQ
jgi:hypothetical protein